MTKELLDRIFKIQNQINEVTKTKYKNMDQGMFLHQEDPNEYWRDNSYWNEEDDVYSFSFSSNGDHKGTLPPDCERKILKILNSYKN
jgi:hypothetical protein